MKKNLFIFLICLFPVLLFAQQKITVVSNIKVSFSEKRGTYRWYKPVFAHEGSTLAADSADYNQGDNFFDAYGNVVITQPNGTVVYADKLHYIEDTQEAILTNNVRLIDQNATLTTNYLTYNMRSKIGTYINNGQIINGTDTLDSRNGYYFENSQDAYFRHNVVVRTPDVKIHTDTMRYNSGSKMTYFYGPTTIEGQNGKLYTENGDYNTETDKARFGKNNLYTEGSKFLWGDSLIYDGKSGNGRAVKNVNFIDTAQHIVMRGQLGTYTKANQSTMITQNAYIVLATKSDSTEQRNPQDSVSLIVPTGIKDTTELKDTTGLEIESDDHQLDSIAKPAPSRIDSTYMSADTLFSQVIMLKDYQFANLKMSREGGELEEDEDMGDTQLDNQPISTVPSDKPSDTLQTLDSLAVKDSLAIKDIIPIDSLKKKPPLVDSVPLNIQDTLLKDSLRKEIPSQLQVPDSIKKQIDSVKTTTEVPIPLVIDTSEVKLDSTLLIPKKGDVDSLINQATRSALSKQGTDTLASDTAETRIIIAYHNVKIFKSDLQAIADSAYFGYPDSIIRCFGSPIFWSQGSQLSADTAYMQLKNEKIDNMLLKNKAFIVSTELDSTKYHQVKGKKISGFFTNDKLDRVFVDGNAESIYYTTEDNKFTGLARSISARIKVLFEDNKMTDVISIRKAATTYYPIAKVPEDQEFLEGFIWKPELRPKSKEEVISGVKTSTVTSPENRSEEKEKIEQGDNPKKNILKETEIETEGKKKEEILD